MPARIQVGPFTYRVTSDWEDYARLGEHPDTYGHTDHKALTITISPRLCYGSAADTLWHEVKHAVARTVGVLDDAELKEEPWINATATMEWATLRANPDLVAYLTAEDDG